MQDTDVHYMGIALQLARKGLGRTSPNPCVGAVIVSDGEIVGQGYHKKAGTPHAEVHAIADAGPRATGATMYVTLEPCNHTGRTPPCTRAILQAGIARVVVGMKDPNPSVEGGGSGFLSGRGIEVEIGILEKECRAINLPFIKHSTTGMPWIVMKAGMSLDGKISYRKGEGGSITGTGSQQFTHELRNSLDAILVGAGTAIIDNPSLTTRFIGNRTRDPLRVILDTHLRLPETAKFFRQESGAQTMIFCGPQASPADEQRLKDAGAIIERTAVDSDNVLVLEEVLKTLGRLNITSILVEGGAKVHAAMLHRGLVDEVYLFIAPFFIGGPGTPLLNEKSLVAGDGRRRLHGVEVKLLGEDALIHGFLSNPNS